VCAILGFMNIVGVALILKWKKLGFWAIVTICALSLLMLMFVPTMAPITHDPIYFPLKLVIICLIGLVVLVPMLYTKVDGVRYWKQLE
jgi:hypothetical protein